MTLPLVSTTASRWKRLTPLTSSTVSNVFSLMLLLTSTIQVSGYRPYPDPGRDIPRPPRFCATRPPQTQCCTGRRDSCTAPLLDTVCYCDHFCNRTISDCCPDYWSLCHGASMDEAETEPPPAPITNNNCVHHGQQYYPGDRVTINCNNCTCHGEGFQVAYNWRCSQHVCIVRSELLDHVNSGSYGWEASNYTMFWGQTLDHGFHYRLGTFPPTSTVDTMTSLRVDIHDVMPEEFDARLQWPGLIKAVQDQGDCGSSWAFSTIGVAGDRISIGSGGALNDELSAQHLISCSVDGAQKGCDGGHVDRAWWHMRKSGIVSSQCYRYTSGQKTTAGKCILSRQQTSSRVTCPQNQDTTTSRLYFATPPYRISPNEREIMKEIMDHGPVQATLDVKEDLFLYKRGVYRHSLPADFMPPNKHRGGYHSVRIIGWGVDRSTGRSLKYWLCVNSWGADWGEAGNVRIARGMDESKIESFVVGVWGKVDGRTLIRSTKTRPKSSRHNT